MLLFAPFLQDNDIYANAGIFKKKVSKTNNKVRDKKDKTHSCASFFLVYKLGVFLGLETAARTQLF